MKKEVLVVMASALMLASCGNVTKEKLGLNKQAPNEFMVSTKAPLTMPPSANLNPVTPAPSVQPKIVLNNVTTEEAAFVKKFTQTSTIARIDEISNAIDKELSRLGNNG